MRSFVIAVLSLLVGACVVLPTLHLAFARPRAGYAPALLDEQLAAWEAGRRDVVRDVNPEWDLAHHTFFALSLANLALDARASDAERTRWRVAVDEVLGELRRRPPDHFHLAYFHGAPFRDGGARSLFLEREILFVLGARLEAWPDPAMHAELDARGRGVAQMMLRAPRGMAESYPDECWTFDNALALAALAVAEHVLGRPVAGAQDAARRWLANVPALTDAQTGLLVSSTTWDGRVLDGPEGSSIFASAHFLELVDPVFAREQYARAKRALVVRPLGFAYAREWPSGDAASGPAPRAGHADVDSGPVIPFVHARAGASGMAILGAAAFADDALVGELMTSLELAAVPERSAGQLRFLASNALGDAVMLYAMTQGRLFARVRQARRAKVAS
jgi:hypothetical protein